MATTKTWQHRYIITNGIRMHYVVQGEGPLLVLLHGFPEFWYSWRHQIPFLAEHGYCVVAPDLRGYNDSDKPRTGYSVSNLLRDIVGLIKGLGYEKASIVGHDWGGALAWVFAMRYAEMTERLIVLNAPHPMAFIRDLRTFKQLRKSWYMFFFQLPWLPEFILSRDHAGAIAQMLTSTALQKSAFPPEVLERYRIAMSRPGTLTAALNYYRAMFRRPLSTARLSTGDVRITAATLLIWGVHDVALDINLTKDLEQWVPDIRVRLVPDSGHWVQQEKPELVNEMMLEFLQQP